MNESLGALAESVFVFSPCRHVLVPAVRSHVLLLRLVRYAAVVEDGSINRCQRYWVDGRRVDRPPQTVGRCWDVKGWHVGTLIVGLRAGGVEGGCCFHRIFMKYYTISCQEGVGAFRSINNWQGYC